MKKCTVIMLVLIFAMSMPLFALAMSHEGQDSSTSEEMMHKGHEMTEHGSEKAEEMMHKGHEMTEHGSEKAEEMEHKAHDMHMEHAKQMSHEMHGGEFATIGEETVDNVKAIAKIMAYDDEKAAMVNATHHIMITFTDEGTNEAITKGKVALKIKAQGTTSKPMMLMQMGDGFGADVRIDKGHYDLEVGTKLLDGKKRQFNYSYMSQ